MYKFSFIFLTTFISLIKGQSHEIKCENIEKIQNPEEYFDEYISEGGYQNLTIKKKDYKISDLNSKDKNVGILTIRIQTQSDGSKIIEDYEKYIPRENEIALFLEDDDRKRFGMTSQKIFFRVGQKIKNSIKTKKTDGLKILSLIKCKILNLNKLPTDDEFVETFENELNK